MAGLTLDAVTVLFLVEIALAVAFTIFGSWLHVVRGRRSAVGLEWLGALPMLATCALVHVGGFVLLPTALLADEPRRTARFLCYERTLSAKSR